MPISRAELHNWLSELIRLKIERGDDWRECEMMKPQPEDKPRRDFEPIRRSVS